MIKLPILAKNFDLVIGKLLIDLEDVKAFGFWFVEVDHDNPNDNDKGEETEATR